MNVLRSLVVALALTGTGVATLAVSPARAADVFEEAGYLAALPVASVPGDGATVADLVFVALNADGTPMAGLKAKLSATSGAIGELAELEPGLYTAQFTPPVVDADTPVTVTVRTVKSKVPITVNVVVPVSAAPFDEVEISANPDALVLGKDDGASLTIQGASDLLTGVSSGSIKNITPMPSGQLTARYVTPKVNFPQLAIVTLADASDPTGRIGHQVIPLHGKVAFPVKAPEGANVILEIAGRKFGPVKADAEGRAKVPVEVPPGVSEALQVVVNGEDSTKETIDLEIPETRRLQLFPLPESLPAEEGLQVPLRVVVATPDGKVDSAAKPTFEVTSGTVTAAAHTEDGVYQATWLLPGKTGAASVTVTMGDTDIQTDTVNVDLVEARPRTVTLTADPPELDKTHTLTAKIEPATGTWKLSATGATVSASGDNDGAGTWTAEITTKGKGDVVVDTWVETAASVNLPYTVVVTPARASAPSDGVSATTVYVAAVDAWGLPVADQKIALSLEGPGALPSSVTTNGDGVATVVLTSGKEPGLSSITATLGGLVGAGAVLQLPRGVARPAALPAAGTEAHAAIAQRWLDTTRGLRFVRDGGEAAAAPPVVEGASATRPDAVPVAFLLTVPDAARPGATVQIMAVALDDAGEPVEGFVPDFMTTKGTLGDAIAGAEGATVTLTIPDDAEGELKISAVGGDGVIQMSTLTIDPDAPEVAAVAMAATSGTEEAASAWGAVDDDEDADGEDTEAEDAEDEDTEDEAEDATDAVADAPTPAPIVERRPSTDEVDVPWLRARVSGVGSTYRYTQAPSGQPGPLLPSTLAVGGPDGGAPASPFGGELDVRAWGDEVADLPYIGVHGQFRAASYGIAAEQFADVASDVLYNVEIDLLGRYPFESGSDLYWVGAKAGFHYNDFILFTGCLEADCTVNFEPLGVPGAALGVELGAEVLDLYLIGGYTFGLAQFSKPYSNAIDLNIGYGFLDNVFADLGLSMLTRTVLLEGQDSGLERGELSDSHLMIKLGAGFQM